MNDAGDQLARFRVVDRVLQQRLADALGDRAVRLAGGDHRVDQDAVIVDRAVARQGHRAGVAVDLDLGDVGAVGEGHPLAGPGVIGVERRAGVARDLRDLEQRDAPVGAGDDEIAVGKADVGLGRFERLGGDAGALFDDLVGGAPDRGAAHIGRARAAVPAAHRDQVGVALAPDGSARSARRAGRRGSAGSVVSWPWPIVWVPVISDTVPSASKRISTFSDGAPPVPLM